MDVAKAARSSLFLAISLTVFGTCGVGSGHQEYEGLPVDVDTTAPIQKIGVTLREHPYSRPLAVANMVVSAMLIIGGMMLSFRRKSAVWFIRNAVTANVLWIVVSTIAVIYFANKESALLSSTMAQWMHTQPGARTSTISSDTLVTIMLVMQSVFACLSALLHTALGVRASRPDIQEFLDYEPEA